MAEIYYDVDLVDPQYEIFKDEDGKYRFRLRAPDGEVLCTSGPYSSKEDCEERIDLVRTHAPSATVHEVT